MKFMVPICVFVLGAVLLQQPLARADYFDDFFNTPPTLPALRLNIDILYADTDLSVDNMPMVVRNVPIYPDDLSYVPPENQGPISRLKYSQSGDFDLAIMGAYQFSASDTSPLRFNIGLGVDLLFASTGDMAERNYTNAVGTDARGEGAALTYAELFQGNINSAENQDSLVNVAPIGKFEVAPFNEPFRTVWFGVSASYFTVGAQNGWDRWDSFEPLDTFDLATVIPVRLYTTCFIGESEHIGLTIGAQLNETLKTNLGEQAGLKVSPVAFFGGLSFRF